LEIDLARAATSDSLSDTVSYAEVHDIAVRVMKERSFNLVESQAQRIAEAILTETGPAAVTVRLSKLLPPIDGVVAAAGVEIRREKASPP
jgi:dihydroneopterin aldolase